MKSFLSVKRGINDVFPKLMECDGLGIIILATSEDLANNSITGTVVHDYSRKSLGKYSDAWDCRAFIDCEHKIVLEP